MNEVISSIISTRGGYQTLRLLIVTISFGATFMREFAKGGSEIACSTFKPVSTRLEFMDIIIRANCYRN